MNILKRGILVVMLLVYALHGSAQSLQSVAFQSIDNMAAAAYSPDGKLLATASKDSITIWTASTKVMYGRTKAHAKKVMDVIFSPDSKYMLSCGDDKTIKIWETTNFRLVNTLSGHLENVNAIAISHDGRLIASVSDDTSVKLWDTESGKITRSYYGHQQKLHCVAFSPDDKLIATAGDDNTLIVQERVSGNIYKKMFHAAPARSLVFSPDGRTIVTGGEGKMLSFFQVHKEAPVVTVNGFADAIAAIQFLPQGKHVAVATKDKNVLILAADSTHQVVKIFKDIKGTPVGLQISPDGNELLIATNSRWKERLKSIGEFNTKKQVAEETTTQDISVTGTDTNPPQIVLVAPKDRNGRITHSTESILLKVKVLDGESGILKATVNGQAVKLSGTGNFEINLPLAIGENALVIEATDLHKNIGRKELTITREDLEASDVDFDPAQAKNYLLVIGIDNYKFWSPLSNAVSDAAEVKNILTSQYTFTDAEVVTLYNDQATRQNIYAAFRELATKMKGNDNLLIYYSGHGYYDAAMSEGYWVPADAPVQSEGDYFANSYMLNLLKRINAKHIFLVADACFSGSLFAEAHRGYHENVEQYKSRWGLTSGRLEFVSDGQAGQGSPFAKAFMGYLKENKSDKFSVTQLIQHVKVEVANVTNQTPIGNPINSIGHDGGEFIFYRKK